jgi:hypothetical protein
MEPMVGNHKGPRFIMDCSLCRIIIIIMIIIIICNDYYSCTRRFFSLKDHCSMCQYLKSVYVRINSQIAMKYRLYDCKIIFVLFIYFILILFNLNSLRLLLETNAMQPGWLLLIFWRNLLPPSSVQKTSVRASPPDHISSQIRRK